MRLDFNLDDEEGGGGGGCALQLTDRLRGWRGRKSFVEVTWTQTVPSVETLVTATLSGRFSTKAGTAAVGAFANQGLFSHNALFTGVFFGTFLLCTYNHLSKT